MKLVLVHGENNLESYMRFNTIVSGIKKRGWEIIRLNSDENIADKLVNSSLFGENNLYVLKDAQKISPNMLDWLNKNHKKFSSQLLLYTDKKLSANLKKLLPKETKIEEFELPKLIFNFVDSLVPNNSKNILKNFKKLEEPRELLIALIGKQFRDIYWIINGGNPLYPSWRLNKIKSHTQKFSIVEIEDIISQLSEIDLKSKTSDVDVDLQLEMFFVRNFS